MASTPRREGDRLHYCASCGDLRRPLAITSGDACVVQHKGRTVRATLPVAIICERCGRENRIERVAAQEGPGRVQ